MTEKITLSGVPETMLQTLYARAKESKGRGAIRDRKAEELTATDFSANMLRRAAKRFTSI